MGIARVRARARMTRSRADIHSISCNEGDWNEGTMEGTTVQRGRGRGKQ